MEQYRFDAPETVGEQLTALDVTLAPCPRWCEGDHFGPHPVTLYADDGFFHYGPLTTITDDSSGLDDGSHDAEIQLGLVSWVPTLAASPGPAFVRLGDGGDAVYHFTPETARQLAAELTRLAEQADRA